MARKTANVRTGPVSLLTLISVLLLSVLAVLCVTSANAAQTLAQRQADALTATYQLDSCGQSMLAAIDEKLQSMNESSGARAASVLDTQLQSVQQNALAACAAEGCSISAQVDGARVSFTVTTASSNKTLAATIRVNDNMTYTIEDWKTTTSQAEPEQTLWTSASSNR